MMFTILPLGTLPTVPEHFVTRAKQLVRQTSYDNLCKNDYTQPGYLDRDLVLADGSTTKSRHVESVAMGDDWEKWVRENIISQFIETGVRTSVGDGISVHGPHADAPIKWKFFYLIEEGGDNVLTSFYLEQGHLAVRNSSPDNIVSPRNYSDIMAIDTVRIPVNRWVFFDTRVIHAVENIITNRTMLVVSVHPDDVTFAVLPRLVDK